jgi:long-chain acyl-CoA synthetase
MTEVDEDMIKMITKHISENGTITSRFTQYLKVIPEEIAYIQGKRKVTWKESIERTYQICQALKRVGIAKGDRVAILSENSIEYAEVMSASLLIGACMVPLPSMNTSRSMIAMLKDSAAKVLVASEALAKQLAPSIDELTSIVKGGKVVFDGECSQWRNMSNWINGEKPIAPEIDLSGNDDFNIIYSSGTTGTPKGILYRHDARNIVANSFFVDLEVTNLISTPLYSNMTIITWYSTIYNGGTTVIMDKFDAEEALQLIEKHKVSAAMFVPFQYESMLNVANFHQYDLSSMKRKYSSSSVLKTPIKRELLERFPGVLIEFYALTEGGAGTILIADLFPTKLDSVGKVGPGQELKIIDDIGNEVPAGEAGEIIGHSPIMSAGYINNEVSNKKLRWHDDGGKLFYKSGDIGRLDEDGFLYLLDRKKDVIISGGVNIYAVDLEFELLSHSDVHEVGVIAAPSEKWGESPVAFVVKKYTSKITGETLRLWVNDRLGKNQKIKEVIFLENLPKNHIGKLLKTKLRDEYAERHINEDTSLSM